jgi:hypothetical protein
MMQDSILDSLFVPDHILKRPFSFCFSHRIRFFRYTFLNCVILKYDYHENRFTFMGTP